MQLRLCLLVCLLFNVFSLKNPSDKILSPKNHSSSESLFESLKKDPLSFVEAFAQADPDKVNEIIDLLEKLAAASLSNKEDLVSKKESADTALNIAQSNLDTSNQDRIDAANALQTATTDNAAAEEAQRNAQSVKNAAQVTKNDADSNLDAQGPGLDDEYAVILQVIQLLRGLLPCSDDYTIKQDSDGVSACYKYVDSKVSWFDARDACAADGAHLVTATSANYDIVSSSNACTWIGANDIDVEGSWVWIDGTPLIETHWDVGEPNNLHEEHCAHTLSCHNGYHLDRWWNDDDCEIPDYGYLCQK